ncbi:sulfatase-like hydrolase/transferase [Oscillibacter sp. MSJ-2]|uniref:Sulfatase-like hydrolase/transferase n=1 Tax=Dysosmobacter acutus TaxID=2841504 RepID=A0ABS6F7A9_9FIRM|nr:sulfatase [Dysosmobacter acutus]MBU5626147.1 sulfatase-like hydrolase/transferase [Dysosmobacter acutus]
MKAIMIMFDSLNRGMLPPYGGTDIIAPNFERLAKHAATFDNFYAGSLPCMPARREIHTGRYNFLHRGWGPIELYDDSMPELLKKSGVYTHLVSDHWHYWEQGGSDYQTKYNSFEYARGKEGDPWKARVEWETPPHLYGRTDNCGRQEYINRHYMPREEDISIAQNFKHGLEFLDDNHSADNWFLQIEEFDPHEPYYVPDRFMELYEKEYHGRAFDWPQYHQVGFAGETEEEILHGIRKYYATVSMCDHYLGQVLDRMDQYGLWDDTMLIVNTDHGFLLTEHNWWGKICEPHYDELVHTPFFLWDPRSGARGVRRTALCQTIDIAPTLLEYFGVERPGDMLGIPLKETAASDKKIRDYALFGMHGFHVNVTDGRYVYMRAPLREQVDQLYDYLQTPTSYPGSITLEKMRKAEFVPPMSFTKGTPLIRLPGNAMGMISDDPESLYGPDGLYEGGNLLFDLETDPKQMHPYHDDAIEQRLAQAMADLMRQNDAPAEQYVRLGLEHK